MSMCHNIQVILFTGLHMLTSLGRDLSKPAMDSSVTPRSSMYSSCQPSSALIASALDAKQATQH